MTTIIKAFLITTTFALTIGVATATVSAPAIADEFATCGGNPSVTC